MNNIDLDELRKMEAVLKEQLVWLHEQQKKERATIEKKLVELYAMWPTKMVVWHDLETGCPTRVEQVRL